MPLTRCTLTGIDDYTPIQELLDLGEAYPFAEFGILYSEQKQGTGRYRRISSIEPYIDYLNESRNRPGLSLHICGRAVGRFLREEDWHLSNLAEKFDRVQLNLRANEFDISVISNAILHWPKPIITQHNESNKSLVNNIRSYPNHQILFDKSGGRGISPRWWPPSMVGRTCGYAGGLGPDNLSKELPKIEHASFGGPYWVDMEGKLRDMEDRFDLQKAEACLSIVAEFLKEGGS